MTAPCDYLVIGHVSRDITADGIRWGGTATYAALTARALGLRPCIVTACHETPPLDTAAIACAPSPMTTTFALTESATGRRLRLQAWAVPLKAEDIPSQWLRAPIVHFAPIANEIPPAMVRRAAGRFVALTPQGWLRRWGKDSIVYPAAWPQATDVLGQATAAVLSAEDVAGDTALVAHWAEHLPVLVLTQGAAGATVYWQGTQNHVPAPPATVRDTTGAGDIFAAAFFVRLYHTRDPLAAARFATALAARSVSRPGLDAIPTAEDIAAALAPAL